MTDDGVILIMLMIAIIWGAWPIYGLIKQVARVADAIEALRDMAERRR